MYMLSCSSRTDSMASSWDGGEPFPGGRAPSGVRRADRMHLGLGSGCAL